VNPSLWTTTTNQAVDSQDFHVMDLHPELAAIAASQGGPFATAQALAAGYEEREVGRLVRSGEWTRLRRGVLVKTSELPDDDAGRAIIAVRAVALKVTGWVIASHRTATTIHQLTTLRPTPRQLDILRPNADRGRIQAGVRWRSAAIQASHVTQVDGVCVTSVARTVLDVVRETDFREGLVLAESALNRGLTTVPELRAVHDFCADWSGARAAGRVVSFASPLSESPGESLSRIVFADGGLPVPLQQQEIYDDAGLIGRVDFLWKKQRTVGEFDGKVKYLGPDADSMTLYAEKRREDRLREAGFEVVRFSWSDIVDRPAWVVAQLLRAFARGARQSA
jgi:very-short-patch-repair endonuclease